MPDPTEHPLGNPDTAAQPVLAEPSIADTILNLDEFLSGDIRRAEKTARFCTRPELEAQIEELHAELDTLTDNQGRPLEDTEQTLAAPGRSARVVASEIAGLQRQYGEAMRSVRLRALGEDDWAAFQLRHKQAFDDGEYPPEFFEDLISLTAVAPKFTAEQVRTFRASVGHAVYSDLANTALRVNLASGVSIPKSLLSSAVLRQ